MNKCTEDEVKEGSLDVDTEYEEDDEETDLEENPESLEYQLDQWFSCEFEPHNVDFIYKAWCVLSTEDFVKYLRRIGCYGGEEYTNIPQGMTLIYPLRHGFIAYHNEEDLMYRVLTEEDDPTEIFRVIKLTHNEASQWLI